MKRMMGMSPVGQCPPSLGLTLVYRGGRLLPDSAEVGRGHPRDLLLHPGQLRLLHQHSQPDGLDPMEERQPDGEGQEEEKVSQ